ncbi:MAG: hypothetical protein AVDCRST_MAG68-4062 [uncultured Gemmatimonadetes bacterium]|uniref:Uncharacterized protein n=1 Tax=uncultured Gemmatimonadota bacterium TaxID=203437 RepID=A0A6J4MD75_9BACT|nr:MAG: hypothetical protein AVDCRST_MAG68-4062 [uncultured Gemmatimonadota bacterium]
MHRRGPRLRIRQLLAAERFAPRDPRPPPLPRAFGRRSMNRGFVH